MDAEGVAGNRDVRVLSGEYADLLSIRTDLQFVADAARRYAGLSDPADADGVLRRALWWSAVIAYRRSFTSGRGHGLVRRSRLVVPDAAVQGLDEAERLLHQAVLDTANQHVGHGVDQEREQMPVSLLFRNGPSGAEEVVGLAQLGALYLGPVQTEALSVADLADHLKQSVESEIEDRRARLLARASELLAGKEVKD